jgi:hypothetical protein
MECILEWVQHSHRCPMCRAEVAAVGTVEGIVSLDKEEEEIQDEGETYEPYEEFEVYHEYWGEEEEEEGDGNEDDDEEGDA